MYDKTELLGVKGSLREVGGKGRMKVYKNPFVSRESYFVKTGKAYSCKNEASKSKGYIVEFIDGKWNAREGCYYDISLSSEMPVIAENKVAIKSIIDRAVINAVLDLVGETKIKEA